jgi:hypothetical protein
VDAVAEVEEVVVVEEEEEEVEAAEESKLSSKVGSSFWV